MMKKTVLVLMLAALLSAAAITPVFAAEMPEYKSLLLLGDSITYGYGLEGTRDTSASYGNLLKNHLGIQSANFTNAAVNGDTSADLLALLPSLAGKVRGADIIVISIGGNDLLGILWRAISEALGAGWTFADVTAGLNDPALVKKLAEQIRPEVITGAVINYTANLASIAELIRRYNGDAEVIFLAQYDPMSGAEGFGEIGAISSEAISLLNTAMKKTVAGCVYLDIRTPFEEKGLLWTNIAAGDIHPNKAGHSMIYQYIVGYLETGLQPDGTRVETLPAASMTETPATGTDPEHTTAPGAFTSDASYELNTEVVAPAGSEELTADPGGAQLKRGCGARVGGEVFIIFAVFIGICLAARKRGHKKKPGGEG